MDTLSKAKRSCLMARVRSHGNVATELVMAKLLRTNHVSGWRRCQKILGNPDFLFPRHRLAIFIDGCFWHGCPSDCRIPSSNKAYWRAKIVRNKARDKLVTAALRRRGWRVLRIWEHELKNPGRCLRRTTTALSASAMALESKK